MLRVMFFLLVLLSFAAPVLAGEWIPRPLAELKETEFCKEALKEKPTPEIFGELGKSVSESYADYREYSKRFCEGERSLVGGGYAYALGMSYDVMEFFDQQKKQGKLDVKRFLRAVEELPKHVRGFRIEYNLEHRQYYYAKVDFSAYKLIYQWADKDFKVYQDYLRLAEFFKRRGFDWHGRAYENQGCLYLGRVNFKEGLPLWKKVRGDRWYSGGYADVFFELIGQIRDCHHDHIYICDFSKDELFDLFAFVQGFLRENAGTNRTYWNSVLQNMSKKLNAGETKVHVVSPMGRNLPCPSPDITVD